MTVKAGGFRGLITPQLTVVDCLSKLQYECKLDEPVVDGMAYPLEIKKSASPSKEDVRHFAALAQLGIPLGPGGVICLAEQALPLTASAWSIPAYTL